jgi:membrane protein
MTGGRKNLQGKTTGRLRSALASGVDILWDAIGNYRTNGDVNQAAAIALYAILSIIPLFILTLLTVQNLFADPFIRQQLTEGIQQVVPSFSGALLNQFGQIEEKKDLLGWVGIVSLIWFSAMIFGALETALNVIFRSKRHRNYFVSKLLAIAMIPLGWAVGVASVVVTSVAAILVRQPILVEEIPFFLPAFQGILVRYLVPYLITVLFFTIVYKVIPTGRVNLKSALIGSAIFSALMEMAKQFFTWYVASYTRYHVIFGSLEAVVILVFWVFYAALILLFCAELISSYQRRDMILLEQTLLKPRRNRLRLDERLFRKFGFHYPAGEYVFREGDTGQKLFYVLSGRVRLEKSAGPVTKVLAEIGPGEYFGEMAALIQSPRTASARTIEESHIAAISGGTLRSLLRDSGEAALTMLKEFSTRLRNSNLALEELARSWIRLTVILYFLHRWPLPPEAKPEEDLARATGRDLSEIEEILAGLVQRGVLVRAGGRVTGFDREAAWRFLAEEEGLAGRVKRTSEEDYSSAATAVESGQPE